MTAIASSTPTATITAMPTYEGCGLPLGGDPESTEEPICYIITPQPTASPTATPIPPDINCSDRNIDLVSEATFSSYDSSGVQELNDMGVVGTLGISPLTNPLINAALDSSTRYSMAWGTSIEVTGRIEFPQTVNALSDKQIWYQINLTNPARSGWIPVRYDGNNYTVGVDPCSGVTGVSTPAQLTFTYDRHAAAEYAIDHSIDLVRNPTLIPQYYVTCPLTIPYADFYYSYLTGALGATGSAFFISEAILIYPR